jgi:hypothetical protein
MLMDSLFNGLKVLVLAAIVGGAGWYLFMRERVEPLFLAGHVVTEARKRQAFFAGTVRAHTRHTARAKRIAGSLILTLLVVGLIVVAHIILAFILCVLHALLRKPSSKAAFTNLKENIKGNSFTDRVGQGIINVVEEVLAALTPNDIVSFIVAVLLAALSHACLLNTCVRVPCVLTC